MASVSVDFKGTYVAQKLCNSPYLVEVGDARWVEATELTTDIPDIQSTKGEQFSQVKTVRMSNLFKNVPFLTSIKMSPRWDGKGLWVAVYEGVVIHAADNLAGGGPKPRECRKLFYSEGPWQAERRVPAKKCDVRCGRKFRLGR